jgi:hypothetical protein
MPWPGGGFGWVGGMEPPDAYSDRMPQESGIAMKNIKRSLHSAVTALPSEFRDAQSLPNIDDVDQRLEGGTRKHVTY